MNSKTLVFIFLSNAIAIFACGQTLSLADLIAKSSCTTHTCFDDFVTRKGFSLRANKQETGGRYYSYQSDVKMATTSDPDITTRNQSIFIINADGTYAVGFGTAVKSQYQRVYDELATFGFKAIGTVSNDDDTETVQTSFKSTRYPKLKLVLSKMQLAGTYGSWAFYNFEVIRTR